MIFFSQSIVVPLSIWSHVKCYEAFCSNLINRKCIISSQQTCLCILFLKGNKNCLGLTSFPLNRAVYAFYSSKVIKTVLV